MNKIWEYDIVTWLDCDFPGSNRNISEPLNLQILI